MSNLQKARDARIGLDGYCAILASIIRHPQTAAQLAQRFRIFPRTMYWMCNALFRSGLIHRREWVKPGHRQKHVPVWAWGREGDVAHEHWRPVARKSGQSALLLGAIRDAVELGPLTTEKLAEDLGFTRQHTRLILRTLAKRKLIRIADWDVREAGVHVALYAFGPGADMKRTAPIGRSPERVAVYRQRHRDKTAHMELLRATAGAIDAERMAA